MICKFCGGPVTIHPEICQSCFPALHAIRDTQPAVLEKITRFVHLEQFMLELRRKKS